MRAGAIGNRVVLAPLRQLLRQESPDLELGGLVLEMAVESGRQGIEALADVRLQPHRDVVVDVDLGREAVDVDDLLVAVGIDANRIEFLELVADRHDRIRLVESEVHVVVAHEADGAQRLRVVVREHPLAVEGGRNRHAQSLGKADQRRTGVGPSRPVTGQDDRVRCLTEDGGGTSHLARGGFVRAWNVDGERSCLR